jgi:PAS domain S-box-containing protein
MATSGEFRHLTDKMSNHVFWVFSPSEDRFVYLSPSFERVWGRPRNADNETPAGWLAAVHPADRERVASFTRDLNRDPYQEEYRILRPDGTTRWIWDRVFPVRDEHGGISRVVGIAADITDRKKGEIAVRKREELFQHVMENLGGEVLWMYSPAEQRMLHVSSAYEEIWGRPRTALYADPSLLLESIHRDDRERVLKNLRAEGIERFEDEYRVLHPDGSVRWIRDRGFPVRNPQGEVVRVVGLAQEVTALKQAQEALRLSEEQFVQLAENLSKQVLWIYAPAQQRLLFVSSAYEEIWGRPRSAAYDPNHSFADAIHPEDRDRVLASPVDGATPGMNREYRILRPDGGVRWIRDRVLLLRNGRGEVERMVGIAEDVSERKRAEEGITLLVSALESSPTAVEILDRDGRIEWVNPAFAKATGYEPQEAVGRSAEMLRPEEHDPGFYESVWETVSRGWTWKGELVRQRKNGSLYSASVTLSPVRDPEGHLLHVVGHHEDISSGKWMEESVRAAQERLRFLLSASPAVIFTCQPSGDFGFTFVSENVGQLGYEARNVLEDPTFFARRLHPDDAPRALSEIAGMGEAAELHQEYRFQHGDGSYRWLQSRVSRVRDAQGTVLGLVGSWIDVTSEKRLEQALGASEEQFRQLALHVRHQVFWVLSPDGHEVLYVSPAYEEIWGRSRLSLGDRRDFWLDAVHPEDVDRVRAQLEGAPWEPVEYRVVLPNGELRWICNRVYPVRTPVGDIFRVVAIAEDVTVRKRAEEALRVSEDQFRRAAEAADHLVFWLLSPTDDRMLYVSSAYEQIWGKARPAAQARRDFWLDAVHADDRESVLSRIGRVTHAELSLEYRIIRPDGVVRWVSNRSFPVRNERGEVTRVVGIVEDVTAERQSEVPRMAKEGPSDGRQRAYG